MYGLVVNDVSFLWSVALLLSSIFVVNITINGQKFTNQNYKFESVIKQFCKSSLRNYDLAEIIGGKGNGDVIHKKMSDTIEV